MNDKFSDNMNGERKKQKMEVNTLIKKCNNKTLLKLVYLPLFTTYLCLNCSNKEMLITILVITVIQMLLLHLKYSKTPKMADFGTR